MLTYRKLFFAERKKLFLPFLCLFFAGQIFGAAVEFTESSFPAIKQSAQVSNRPYLAYFTAKWCMPCRMMDESTWTDPNLAWYMKQNYFAAKIDIEDFDGYAYAEQYKVQAYPTILLFAPDGKLLKRIEGSVTGSKLLEYLKKHDNYEDNNVATGGPDENVPAAPTPIVTESSGSSSSYNLPPTEPDPIPETTPSGSASAGTGLFVFNVERAVSEGYGVQVGVYADYENVLREVAIYQKQFKQTVLVHIAKLNGKTVYKILIGDFKNQQRAVKMKEEIAATGLPDVFVKDLSTVK